MAIALVAGRTDPLGTDNDGTTTAIDTTGCTLLVVSMAWYSAVTATATFTDSKSNTWTPLTSQTQSDGTVRQWYSVSPSVGSGHTWTGGGEIQTFTVIQILGFSGTHTAPFDQESGATGLGVAFLSPGSITPSQANQVFVTSEVNIGIDTTGLPTGYTGAALEFTGGAYVGSGMASKIQSGGASAENPQWTWTGVGGGNNAAAVMSTFKEAAGGSTTHPSWMMQGGYW